MDIVNEFGQQRTPDQIKADPGYATLPPERREKLDVLCDCYEAEQEAVADQKAADVAVAGLARQCQMQRDKMRPTAAHFMDAWAAMKEAHSNPDYQSAPPDPKRAAMQDDLDELEKRLAMARDLHVRAHNGIKASRAATAAAITSWQSSNGAPLTQAELLRDNAAQQAQLRADVKEGRVTLPQNRREFLSTLDAVRASGGKGAAGFSQAVGRRGAYPASARGRMVDPPKPPVED